MLDQESSQRLNVIRFPLIVSIVFLHNYGVKVGLSGGDIGISQDNYILDFVRTLISQGFARVAVPLFFLISGYLFFVGIDFSRKVYFHKVMSRTRTLLLPFLFWNIMTLLFIALAQALPATQTFFSVNHTSIASYEAFDYLSAIFGIGRSPIAYQFLFLRDLMILVLLVPIIYYANKLSALPFLLALFICWLLDFWPLFAPRAESTLFFCLGTFLGAERYNVFSLDKIGALLTTIYLPLVVFDSIFPEKQFHPYLHRTGVAIGVAVALFLTKFIVASPRFKNILLTLSGASFFVYATHEPLLTILRKVTYKVLIPESCMLTFALYFIIPTVLICSQVSFYSLLSDILPRFSSVITGGRTGRQSRFGTGFPPAPPDSQ